MVASLFVLDVHDLAHFDLPDHQIASTHFDIYFFYELPCGCVFSNA
jgi:hypothetical protein